jgi:hypothetical protein
MTCSALALHAQHFLRFSLPALLGCRRVGWRARGRRPARQDLCRVYFEEMAAHDMEATIKLGSDFITSCEKANLTPEEQQRVQLSYARRVVADAVIRKKGGAISGERVSSCLFKFSLHRLFDLCSAL